MFEQKNLLWYEASLVALVSRKGNLLQSPSSLVKWLPLNTDNWQENKATVIT